jgi:hypothetical protein
MLGIILDMLDLDEFYNVSKEIEIANGKNQLQTNFKGAWKQHKRDKKWHK